MANIGNNVLKLEQHQKEAYINVEALLAKQGKAAVIFPTGCGKSFVTLEYILNHPDDRILFLSPRNAIKDQMYEYVIRQIGGDFRDLEEIKMEHGNQGSESLKRAAKQYIPNLECMLYQTILGLDEKDSVNEVLEKLKPDIIVIDEMHHLKTKGFKQDEKREVVNDEYIEDITTDEEELDTDEEISEANEYIRQRREEINRENNKWGEKFNLFLERNPQAKLLGLSATPIRTDGANVVERIFENAVASEISLLEAIEEGIIFPPKYVVPDFIREEEFQTLLEKIELAEGDNKVKLQEQYDELVKRSAEAPGIPELMKEHITETNGKYIIFCKDINDMKEKMEKAKEWFGDIDEEPEIYGIHSKDNTSARQLEEFNKLESEHLKLMYCVGMIDEGVHLNNVSGVILATKTGSRPTYLQRLGRTISSGESKKQALVIDLVNNNEILAKEGKVQYGFEITDLEAMYKVVDWMEEKNNGELPVYNEEKTTKERAMALRLARLNNKYLKYVENEDLLISLSEEKQDEIIEIIELGKSIGILNDVITIEKNGKNIDINQIIDQFLSDIEIKGVRKDFRELLENSKMNKNFDMHYFAIAIRKWMEDNNTTIPPSSTSENEKEKKLGYALANIRYKLIKPYKEIKDEEDKKKFKKYFLERPQYSLTEKQFEEILSIIEEIDKNNIPKFLIDTMNIRDWMKRNNTNKPPSTTARNEEEKKLGKALNYIRRSIINPYKEMQTEEERKKFVEQLGKKIRNSITEEQFKEIFEIVKEIDENNLPRQLVNIRNIYDWIKNNGKKPSRSSLNNE